jgi:hypothetical protein
MISPLRKQYGSGWREGEGVHVHCKRVHKDLDGVQRTLVQISEFFFTQVTSVIDSYRATPVSQKGSIDSYGLVSLCIVRNLSPPDVENGFW